MNPLEMIDIRHKQMLNGITEIQYSCDDVRKLITKAFAFAKQAYMSGEFIFELESFDNEKLVIDNTTYKVSKVLGENDKYTMIIQMLNVPEGDMTQSDMGQLSNAIRQAIHNNPHISGVVLLPANYDITLMTAKLGTSDYEMPVEFSEGELEHLLTKKDLKSISTGAEFMELMKHLYDTVPNPVNSIYTDTIKYAYDKVTSDKTDEGNPYWEE